jgi:hypothetical protein
MSISPNQYIVQESLRQQTPLLPTAQPLVASNRHGLPHSFHVPGNEHDRQNFDPEEEDENSDLNRRRRYAWAQQIIAEENSRMAAHVQANPSAVIPDYGDDFGPRNDPNYLHGRF